MVSRLAILVLLLTACSGCPKEENNHQLVNSSTNNNGPPSGADGARCVGADQCDGGSCLQASQGWPGGYCTTTDCADGCNGEEAACVAFLDDSSMCFDTCATNTECRTGYRCRTLDATGRRVCYRDLADGPPPGAIGAECRRDDDCFDGLECDDSMPGGYCLKPDCDGSCPEGSECVEWDGVRQCIQFCAATRDCRVGYVCDLLDDKTVCVPGEAVEPPFEFAVTENVLGIRCDAEEVEVADGKRTWRIDFEVPEGSTSYTFVPFVRTGALRPISLTTPEETVDLIAQYRHHNIRATEFQFYDQESQGTFGEVALDWPITVPYAPQFADLVTPGMHTLEVATTIDEPCVYVVAAEAPGTILDLNVYFVGLEGFSADTAGSDPDLTEVFNRVDELLGVAGVRLGDVQFHDAPREVSERYQYVRSLDELKRAVAFGTPRDETLRGHLNVDVFLVNDLSFEGVIVFGLSAGLPGPPGLHGNPANGLVFTGADIGSDNAFAAHVMAHELGHYLGLRHTTEVVFGSDTKAEAELDELMSATDPIEDTPECDVIQRNLADCPDIDNLMFPAAPMEAFDAQLTEDQAAALRAYPLLR